MKNEQMTISDIEEEKQENKENVDSLIPDAKNSKLWAENIKLKKQLKELQKELEIIKKFIGGV